MTKVINNRIIAVVRETTCTYTASISYKETDGEHASGTPVRKHHAPDFALRVLMKPPKNLLSRKAYHEDLAKAIDADCCIFMVEHCCFAPLQRDWKCQRIERLVHLQCAIGWRRQLEHNERLRFLDNLNGLMHHQSGA